MFRCLRALEAEYDSFRTFDRYNLLSKFLFVEHLRNSMLAFPLQDLLLRSYRPVSINNCKFCTKSG